MRAFIAIPLPQSLLERLADLQHRLEKQVPHRSVRWVRIRGIHLTLKFLGDTPTEKLPDIEQALEVVARHAPACSLTAEGLGCFPNPRHPRVLWVGVREPTGRLGDLWHAIEEAMTSLGYPPERHSFTPHLTLARVRRRASGGDVAQVSELLAGTEVEALGEVPADRFALIRSVLKPTGAEYTTLRAFSLQGADVAAGVA